MRPRTIASAVLSCLVGITARAAASSYWVDWQAPPSCSSPASLNEQIAARSDGARSDPEGASYLVDVSQDPSGYVVARAVLPNGSTRFVRALRCDEVVAAIAFIVSMDLERQTDTAEAVTATATLDTPPAAANWRTYLGATGGFAGGHTPSVLPLGGLFFELADETSSFSRRGRVSVVFGAGELGARQKTFP